MLLRFLAALAVAAPLHGQIMRLPNRSGEPGSFLTVAIGLRQQQAVSDGSTGSTWDFGQGVEYRGSLERHLRNGTSFGVAYGQVNMPLRYSNTLFSGNAHTKIQTLMLVMHGGGTRGFHQVFDVAGGVTRYSSFKRDSDGSAIASARAKDDDLTFALGYGLGYAFTGRTAVTVVQEYGLVVHQNDGLSGSASRSSQVYTTRLGLRMGFGSKGRRRGPL